MIVVKIGGGEGVDVDRVAEDAARLVREGTRMVIVHGASHEASTLGERLGVPPSFITSPSGHTSRRTDAATLEVFVMACAAVNTRLVAGLLSRGVRAAGMSGLDGRLWEGRRKDAIRAIDGGRTVIVRDDQSGSVERVDAGMLRALMGVGVTPVLSPPGASLEGGPINVDADRAASATALALRASVLVLLSNVPGLMRRPPDESTLVPRVPRAMAAEAEGWAQGRMKKKVLAASEAVAGGVERAIIADARAERPIARALAGEGTVFE